MNNKQFPEFRVWVPETNKMAYKYGSDLKLMTINYNMDTVTAYIADAGYLNIRMIQITNPAHVMQWTGITDDNKVKIHDKDIMRRGSLVYLIYYNPDEVAYVNLLLGHYNDHNEYHKYDIEKDDYGNIIYCKDLITGFHYPKGNIIGNTFENPEYLQEGPVKELGVIE